MAMDCPIRRLAPRGTGVLPLHSQWRKYNGLWEVVKAV